MSFCFTLNFAASAFAHQFNCLTVETRKILFVIDYAGVGAGALGVGICYIAFIPEEMIAFGNRGVYSAIFVITVCMATACCSTAMVYWSEWPAGQFLKAASFGTVAAQGNVQMISYLGQLSTSENQTVHLTQTFWIYIALKLTAGFFLSTCLPERLFPKTFDVWGQSHQLFHILVFFSLVYQYKFLVALSNVNPSLPNTSSFRVTATVILGFVGLAMVVLWFTKQINPNKQKLISHGKRLG